MQNKKIVILAIHGTPFNFLYPWIKKGALPNFEKMLCKGAGGGISAAFPPVHSVSWASFFTGRLPLKHGLYDTISNNTPAYTAIDGLAGDTLLDILEQNGKKGIFVNVPFCFTGKYDNAIMIGRLPPSQTQSGREELFIHPERLRDDLEKHLKNHEVYVEKDFDSRGISRIIKDLHKSLDVQTSTVRYLLQNFEYDVLVTAFGETDRLLHLLSACNDRAHPDYDDETAAEFNNATIDFYKKLDDRLGDILATIGEDVTLLVISDFGVAPVDRFIDINAWLHENGYLAVKKSAKRHGAGVFIDTAYEGAKRKESAISRLIGENHYKKRFDDLQEFFISEEDIDWEKTRAFSAGGSGQIYINLKDRYPKGVVDAADYKQLLHEIEKKIKSLRDPGKNKKVVAAVIKKDIAAQGSFTKDAPDIIIKTDGLKYHPFSSLRAENAHLYQEFFPTFTGHGSSGLLMAIGPEIRAGAFISYAHIMDMLPTILYMLDMEIPSHIDGKVIREAIKKNYLKTRKVLHNLKTAEAKNNLWETMEPVKIGI